MSGAWFGLIGVLVGAVLTAFLTWTREVLADHRARARQARYLAIRVVCILDKYVERCAEAASDRGMEDEKGRLITRISSPDPPEFPTDLDWKSIDHGLMYRLLSLPNEAETADRQIDGAADNSFPPDYAEFYEERQAQYATVGLLAFALTQELRQKYAIPAQEFDHWNPAECLAEIKRKVEQRREDREKQYVPPPVITPQT